MKITMKLYSHPLSLNCYKVRLLLSFLQQKFESENVDLVKDVHKSTKFLELNPLGQLPVLIDNDYTGWDSQAILVYLARKFEDENWLPLTAKAIAQVNSWLSFAAKELSIGLASARVHYILGGKDIEFVTRLRIDIDRATFIAEQSLEVLNRYLANREWLVGDAPTIADIACFPTVAFAHEGKIMLEDYPHVRAWAIRFRQLPNFIEM
jgi:glutathione S-transferase